MQEQIDEALNNAITALGQCQKGTARQFLKAATDKARDDGYQQGAIAGVLNERESRAARASEIAAEAADGIYERYINQKEWTKTGTLTQGEFIAMMKERIEKATGPLIEQIEQLNKELTSSLKVRSRLRAAHWPHGFEIDPETEAAEHKRLTRQ